MLKSLELFPNYAIYHDIISGVTIEVPPAVSELISIVNNRVVPSSQIRDGPFSPGTLVTVDGIEGTIVRENEIQRSDVSARIYQPKQIVSGTNYNKEYSIETQERPVFVQGKISNIGWSHSYIVILGSDNLIRNFQLLAKVRYSGVPFSVDSIRFLEETSQKKYLWNKPLKITTEVTLPLDGFQNQSVRRVYFLKLEQQAQPQYGYSFDLSQTYPPGPVRVLDSELQVLGESMLEVHESWILLRVAREPNLQADLILKEDSRGLTFTLQIDSRFTTSVDLILEKEISKRVVKTDPIASTRIPGRLLWNLQIVPGRNSILGNITYDNR